MKRIVVATTNPNKVYEVRSALASLGEGDWEVLPQPSNVSPVDETGATFLDNAILKAVHVSQSVDDLVLADDSGLCVDALDGRPGVLSHRYAGSDPERIRRILTEMKNVPEGKRSAAFICALALARHSRIVWTGEGRVAGTINFGPAGTNGFGYDPIFLIPEFGRTMAELTIQEKNATSHRGRALREFVQHFTGLDRL